MFANWVQCQLKCVSRACVVHNSDVFHVFVLYSIAGQDSGPPSTIFGRDNSCLVCNVLLLRLGNLVGSEVMDAVETVQQKGQGTST